MNQQQPVCYVIGGPNGAGKTSVSLRVLPQLHCMEYVNADALAAALSPFRPEKSALEAGRMMLRRIHELASHQTDFAFETTLASRSFAFFLEKRKAEGYRIILAYFYLDTPDLAVARVQQRVATGGHNIPETDIRRRYERSLENLVNLYLPLADSWKIYQNSYSVPVSIAWKDGSNITVQHEKLAQLIL